MTHRRLLALLIVAAAAVVSAGGCAGAAPSAVASARPSPTFSPAGGLVDTPGEAVAAVAANQPRLAGIAPFRADLIGQSSWYKVTPASGVGAYVVEIRIGWGDCEAGCIDDHRWVFAVLPDGTVNLQSETGGAVPSGAWPQPSASGQTGISGVATAGPTCPVQKPGDSSCDPRPVAGAGMAIVDGSGAIVARTTSGIDGTFFVAVPAGTYTVRAAPVDGLMGTPAPVSVVVVDGSASQVALDYDTGIR